MTRIAAVDHGAKRIGLAVADVETGLAFPREAIVRRGGERPEDAVASILRRDGVATVVVGLPLHAGGDEGSQASVARRFGERLAERGFEVVYWDERLTSWEAAQHLGRPRHGRERASRASGEVDSAAARIILQDYLDAERRRAGGEREGS